MILNFERGHQEEAGQLTVGEIRRRKAYCFSGINENKNSEKKDYKLRRLSNQERTVKYFLGSKLDVYF